MGFGERREGEEAVKASGSVGALRASGSVGSLRTLRTLGASGRGLGEGGAAVWSGRSAEGWSEEAMALLCMDRGERFCSIGFRGEVGITGG